MAGFLTTLFGVCLYALIVGLIRYYMSKKTEVYFDGMDIFIMIFYSLFNMNLGVLSYTVWLFGSCFVILLLGLFFKPVGRIFFDWKYYWYKKGEK